MNKPWLTAYNDHDYFDKDHVARFLRNHNTGVDNWGRHALAGIINSYEGPLSILDAPCGTACNFEVFESALNICFSYTGLDRTQQFLDHAKKLYGDRLELKHGYVQELPYESGSFDITIGRHIFEHLEPSEMELAIKELVRVANREAILVFFLDPHMGPEHIIERRSSNIPGKPEIMHYWNTLSWPKLLNLITSLPFVKQIMHHKVITPGAAAADIIVRVLK